jgi:hypothetical protein
LTWRGRSSGGRYLNGMVLRYPTGADDFRDLLPSASDGYLLC